MNYDNELPGCFGISDLIFAGHPADEDRAFAWMESLRRRGIGFKDAQTQIENFLLSKNASAQHIADQVINASRYLKPWLLD